VSFCEFRVDDSQSQVKQEESASKYKRNEENKNDLIEAFLHISLNFTPTLESYTLENG
jgi:hypothetical protein